MTYRPTKPKRPGQASRVGLDQPGSAEPVEVAVLAFRANPPPRRSSALARLRPRLFTGAPTRRLVFLPGFTPAWPRDLDELAGFAEDLGADVLFEECLVGHGLWRAVTREGRHLPWTIAQRFGSSAEANREPAMVRDLVEACRPGGERRLSLAGSDVGLLCCGENNVLQNAQSDGNAVRVRHGASTTLFEGARIVFNGAHTNMGNWGKLNRRFEWLSAGPRLALYATNNSASGWTSSLGAWWGGERLASGSEVLPPGVARSTRLVTAPEDQARALVVHLARGEGSP